MKKRNFDQLVNWANKFHLLQPLRFGEEDDIDNALEGLHRMLKHNGVPIVDINQFKEHPEEKHFHKCDCGTWKMCGWCHHACICMENNGLIEGHPPLKQPCKIADIQGWTSHPKKSEKILH